MLHSADSVARTPKRTPSPELPCLFGLCGRHEISVGPPLVVSMQMEPLLRQNGLRKVQSATLAGRSPYHLQMDEYHTVVVVFKMKDRAVEYDRVVHSKLILIWVSVEIKSWSRITALCVRRHPHFQKSAPRAEYCDNTERTAAMPKLSVPGTVGKRCWALCQIEHVVVPEVHFAFGWWRNGPHSVPRSDLPFTSLPP